jgi:RNA polymerase sigma-70 factor (ECF subfamily)
VAEVTPIGDVERFERIFIGHVDAVFAYAVARVDRETAYDATADTFLVAWRRLADVPDPPRAWLVGVTRRTLADQRRSQRRQLSLVARLARARVEPASMAPEDIISERSAVFAALDALREADRELLCLISWDGLDHVEAAEVLGCSPGAFKVRLHRARGRLERALADEDGRRLARSDATTQVAHGEELYPQDGGGGE